MLNSLINIIALLPEAEVLGDVAIDAEWVSDLAVGTSVVVLPGFTVSQKSEGNALQYKYLSAKKRNPPCLRRDSNSVRAILSSPFLSINGK